MVVFSAKIVVREFNNFEHSIMLSLCTFPRGLSTSNIQLTRNMAKGFCSNKMTSLKKLCYTNLLSWKFKINLKENDHEIIEGRTRTELEVTKELEVQSNNP